MSITTSSIANLLREMVDTGNLELRLTHLPPEGELHDLGWAVNDVLDRFETFQRDAQGVLARHSTWVADQRIDPRGFAGTFTNTITAFNLALSDGDRLRTERERTLATVKTNAATVIEVAGQLAGASHRLSTTLVESATAAHEARDAMGLAAGHTRNAASACTAMSQAINDISRSMHEAHEVSTDASTKAAEANVVMARLGGSSRDIGQVAKLITAISQQTNLLALNAAIEAARAGAAGRGFTVVANEVKDLARRTKSSSEDIEQRIGTIQADAASSGQALVSIREVVERLNVVSATVSSATAEQASTTSEIERMIREVVALAERTEERIAHMVELGDRCREVAQSAAAQSAALQECARALQDVARDG